MSGILSAGARAAASKPLLEAVARPVAAAAAPSSPLHTSTPDAKGKSVKEPVDWNTKRWKMPKRLSSIPADQVRKEALL